MGAILSCYGKKEKTKDEYYREIFDGLDLDAEFTNIYSVANPVELIFLAVKISPVENPVTFATDIVVSVAL